MGEDLAGEIQDANPEHKSRAQIQALFPIKRSWGLLRSIL